MTEEKEIQKVIAAARAFQRDSAQKWNPHLDEVTETSYMGMVTMDEG